MVRVVSYLRSTVLKVKSLREEVFTDEGLREKRMRAELESEQMNLTWNWFVPFFDGEARTQIPVKAVWEVQSGMSVKLILLDQGTIIKEREAKQKLMDDVVAAFESTIGVNEVAIVYVNGNQS